MGLVSYGGVHSHMDHLKALLIMAKKEKVEKVFVHAFLDGRDVVPKSAMSDLTELQKFMETEKIGQIASIMGRFYAMDRDKRWERTQIAYDALTLDAKNENIVSTENWKEALQASFDKKETDEFVKPIVLLEPAQKRIAKINDGDSVLFFNFRPDRARQLTYSFIAPEKIGFSQKAKPKVNFICMTQYDEELAIPIAYPPKELKNTLGEYLSKLGKKQLRIAETEKYAHVTFFFNGGMEEPNAGEDRILIPSPKVNTYDLKPEMSAYEVTGALLQKIDENKYDFIVLNFANMDMVGHTGIYSAAVAAVEAVDACIGKLVDKMLEKNGTVMIMADHGNAEKMLEDDGSVCTSHTTNPVTLIYIGDKKQIQLRAGGKLCDIAPTILETMDIQIPPEMTGISLLIEPKQ
jgi:2,3-bisphosphoglycerate-independent phosphoglycerate mutase